MCQGQYDEAVYFYRKGLGMMEASTDIPEDYSSTLEAVRTNFGELLDGLERLVDLVLLKILQEALLGIGHECVLDLFHRAPCEFLYFIRIILIVSQTPVSGWSCTPLLTFYTG